ncbi:1-deoxy-D-xylulose-5-phosphate reductoisomerase [Anoxynatronum buryatiense]|uniref:1-deoxy-D-xylulose-5-phosphate reductoisomerase n=1 Tax=Anoxynatronum buryatiense TaxID=489973 RepID=UPI0024B75C45|nr:1-deoxy-D-xylulose-5-phosphate reductoisomerase [Anoxynatronum buryatiense]
MSKKISLLGSTGSIGTQALDVVRRHREEYEVVALTAGHNIDLLAKQIIEFRPKVAILKKYEDANHLSRILPTNRTRILHGDDGLETAVSMPETELVLNALVGSRGLTPSYLALKNGKDLALANKESLVSGGMLMTKLAARNGKQIIPVDSEHSAIFQCLNSENKNEVKRVVLTASGGPFRTWSRESINRATLEDALNHPNWSMGRKITIDSATMMNKGLEIIEAAWLFDLTNEQIDVLIHPQSIVHSMVEFQDTSVLAQMGLPDMRVPIQYALSWPKRLKNHLNSLDLLSIGALTFEAPNVEKFPCLRLAREALVVGKTLPCVMNAANDFLVESFLQGKISVYQISDYIERVMHQHVPFEYLELEELIEVENWTRSKLKSFF